MLCQQLQRTVLGAVAVCALMSAPALAAPAPPPSLNGATFTARDFRVSQVHCNLAGRSSFAFRASGDVIGPPRSPDEPTPTPLYTGTFSEVGAAVIGPQNRPGAGLFPDGAWVRINAAFTIVSGEWRVVGEKHLADATYNFPSNEAVCATFPNPTAPDVVRGYAVGGTSDQMAYTAVMRQGSQTCFDRGSGYMTMVDANYESTVPGASFNEQSLFEAFSSPSGQARC